MKKVTCIGCSASVPDIEGPTHKYLGTSPGCWKIYSEVLGKEYSDNKYMKIHHLTVDAYSLQHIGVESPKTIQSMNLHLMSLCAYFEYNIKKSFIPSWMNTRLQEYKDNKIFNWLTPPSSLGETTILDILPTDSPESHTEKVEAWAREIWQKWSEHHNLIKNLVKDVLDSS